MTHPITVSTHNLKQVRVRRPCSLEREKKDPQRLGDGTLKQTAGDIEE
jgi:hypothetical protein